MISLRKSKTGNKRFQPIEIKAPDVTRKFAWYAIKVSYLNIDNVIIYMKKHFLFIRNIYKITNIESDYRKLNNDIIFIELKLTAVHKKLILMYRYIYRFFPDNNFPAIINDFQQFLCDSEVQAKKKQEVEDEEATEETTEVVKKQLDLEKIVHENTIVKEIKLIDVKIGDSIIINTGIFKGCRGIVNESHDTLVIVEIISGLGISTENTYGSENSVLAEVHKADIDLVCQ